MAKEKLYENRYASDVTALTRTVHSTLIKRNTLLSRVFDEFVGIIESLETGQRVKLTLIDGKEYTGTVSGNIDDGVIVYTDTVCVVISRADVSSIMMIERITDD